MTPHHLFHALGHLWSSDVGDAAVEHLAPATGETILDLGSGLGPTTIQLARRVGSSGTVIAVDPSRAMRSVLRLRVLATRSRRRGPIRQLNAHAESLPLQDATAHAVLGCNMVHHLNDIDAAAARLCRVIQPGGRLVLIDEDFDDPSHSFHTAGDRHSDGTHSHRRHHDGPDFVDPDRFVAALSHAGFRDVHAEHRHVASEPAYVFSGRRE